MFTLCPRHITVYITLKSIFITCMSVQWGRQMEHLQMLQYGNFQRCQVSLNKPEGFPLGLPCVMRSSNSSMSSRNASPLLSSLLLASREPNYKSRIIGQNFDPDTYSVPDQCIEPTNPWHAKWVPALLTFDLLGLGHALFQLHSSFYEGATTCSFKNHRDLSFFYYNVRLVPQTAP